MHFWIQNFVKLDKLKILSTKKALHKLLERTLIFKVEFLLTKYNSRSRPTFVLSTLVHTKIMVVVISIVRMFFQVCI